MASQPILEVTDLTMDFGGLRALDHLNLKIHAGEIVALIGPNGAGKTTFFNCLTGIYPPTKGEMLLPFLFTNFCENGERLGMGSKMGYN